MTLGFEQSLSGVQEDGHFWTWHNYHTFGSHGWILLEWKAEPVGRKPCPVIWVSNVCFVVITLGLGLGRHLPLAWMLQHVNQRFCQRSSLRPLVQGGVGRGAGHIGFACSASHNYQNSRHPEESGCLPQIILFENGPGRLRCLRCHSALLLWGHSELS